MSWYSKHKSDPFVREANRNSYISRAYFKIQAIDKKYGLFNLNKRVLDIGAAPGGWSQYIVKITKSLVAIDRSNTFQVPEVEFILRDIFDWKEEHRKFDVIISDLSPDITGQRIVDAGKFLRYFDRFLEILNTNLDAGGSCVIKIFTYVLEDARLLLSKLFKKVDIFKPAASRSESSEIYLVGLNYIGPSCKN